MARLQLGSVVRFLDRVVGPGCAGDETDEHLLERFALHRDESAFEALVQRHGPMVLGVCRRVLNDLHDTEDAFQAAFFVFARKAASIRRRGSLDSWLYGVAYRIAVKAKTGAARRRARERQAALMSQADPNEEVLWREARPVLDEELSRLPEKYRAPVVLCYLNGKTNEQAARQLGWTKGTVSGRLARARELLRARLARRGLTLSAGLLAGLLAQNTAAAVPPALAASTAKAATLFARGPAAVGAASTPAAALAEEALGEMWRSKINLAIAVVMAVVLLGLGILVCGRAAAARPDRPQEIATLPVPTAGGGCCGGHGQEARLTLETRAGVVLALAFASDGRTLASGGDRVVWLWDTAGEKRPVELRGHQGPVQAVAFAPETGLLASGSADHTVRLWDPVSARERVNILAHAGGVHAVAFAPDGKTLASAGADHVARLWDVASGKERAVFRGHTAAVLALTFSADGQTLLTSGADGSLKLWDVAGARPRATLTGHAGAVLTVALSPDGRTAASGGADQTLRLWNAATGRLLHTLQGHEGPVRSVTFTPDGQTLISGGADHTVRLWVTASGLESTTLAGHTDGVNAVAVDPKGPHFASAAHDRTIKLWQVKRPASGR